jgi:hypothetical protein
LFAFGVGCRSSVESVQLGIAPSAGWRAAPIASFNVPGTPVAAWSGPQGASLVAYTALPIPRGTAAGVSEDLANLLTNLPGLRVVERRTETWDGHEAARVEVVAPGTGDALAPSGTGTPVAPPGRTLVPTHRVSLAFLRPSDTLWLTWHYPESAHAELAPQIEAMLRTLRVGSVPLASSSY